MENCQKTHLCSVILTCSARNKGISYDNLSEKIGQHGMIGTITGSCHTRTINEIADISPPGSQYNWVSSVKRDLEQHVRSRDDTRIRVYESGRRRTGYRGNMVDRSWRQELSLSDRASRRAGRPREFSRGHFPHSETF